MVPLATTKVTIRKPVSAGDPYEESTAPTLASGVRAHISAPTGREAQTGGTQEHVDAVLLCDPVDGLDHYCFITDETTTELWQIVWARTRHGLGLDHVRAGLVAVAGGSGG